MLVVSFLHNGRSTEGFLHIPNSGIDERKPKGVCEILTTQRLSTAQCGEEHD